MARRRGGGVEVTGGRGKVVKIRGQEFQQRHFFGLCPVCLKIGEHSACSGCLMVSYCSRACQKTDWKSHKTMCKLLGKLRGGNGGNHLFHKDPEAHVKVSMAVKEVLGRQLSQYESDMLVHARICIVCLSGDQASLQNCPQCHCVAYCSQECREEDEELHQTVCDTLHHCITDYMFEAKKGHQLRCYLPPPCSTVSSLPPDFPAVFEKDISALLSDDDDEEYKESELRRLTFQYTCPATVFHAASVAGTRTGKLADATSLVIHLVGARQVEIEQAPAWTLFSSRLQKLKSLTLVLVGPEVGGSDLPSNFSMKSNNAVVKFIVEKPCGYQQYAKSKGYLEPDLVAALNCGFIFYTSWDSSLDTMVRKSGAPLVFTEYYQADCQLNLEKLEKNTKKNISVILEPTANPFCSRFAARIPAGFGLRKYKRKNVLMSNDFMCIVKAE